MAFFDLCLKEEEQRYHFVASGPCMAVAVTHRTPLGIGR